MIPRSRLIFLLELVDAASELSELIDAETEEAIYQVMLPSSVMETILGVLDKEYDRKSKVETGLSK